MSGEENCEKSEKEGAKLSEEYKGLNGSEIIEKVRKENERRTIENDWENNSDEEVSEDSTTLEPAAWMTYQAAGGPGKVPYLTKIRAERANNTEDGYPKPLFTADQILDLMYENPNLAVLREKLEEFTQKTGEEQ